MTTVISKLGSNASGTVGVDLARLLETRLLAQANSGGGKSWLLRRLLEQTAGKVQQIVIDPEGEFATLREKFDYVIGAHQGGDALTHPRTASLFARRLLETNVSAILDIYDLKAYERQQFVRNFLEALVNSPRRLWHPVLVVLDEAHVYAPEKGRAESTSAVIDMATRGRKRGFCLCLATQRLSKLHKDAAAEMINKLIGRTGLDIDVKRAADELGMTSREAMNRLRQLGAGEFYAFGPAISHAVTKVKIGPVSTPHPELGKRLMVEPPAPSSRIRKVLRELVDLPKEAEEEARSLDDLRKQVTALKGKLTEAEKRVQQAGTPEAEVTKRERAAERRGREQAIADGKVRNKADDKATMALRQIAGLATKALGQAESRPKREARQRMAIPEDVTSRPVHVTPEIGSLRKGAVKILAELAARAPAGYSKPQLGTLTRYSHKGGTFNTYMSNLRHGGLIEERDGLVFASDTGIEALGDQVPEAPTSHEEAMRQWSKALRAGAYRMLETVVGAGAEGINRQDLAYAVEMTATGGTFNTYLSDLRRNGLIADRNAVAIANDILFPEA